MNTENNILIAKFMNNIDPSTNEYYRMVFNSGDFHKLDDLSFHDSWDWLMPVIEKCYQIEVYDSNNLIGDITCGLMNTDITETYKACVEIIKYSNK